MVSPDISTLIPLGGKVFLVFGRMKFKAFVTKKKNALKIGHVVLWVLGVIMTSFLWSLPLSCDYLAGIQTDFDEEMGYAGE